MSTADRRRWVQVGVAAIAMLAVAALAIVGGTMVFIYRHVRSEVVPAATAEERIASARARFGSSQPFLRVGGERGTVVNGREPAAGSQEALATLRALAYDSTARKLVDISIPFWLLRLVPNGRISLDASTGIDFGAERVSVNLAALEGLGPGLVLDHSAPSGTTLLVWTE